MSLSSLQTAIWGVLSGDATLLGLLTQDSTLDPIFFDVPHAESDSPENFPYLTVFPITQDAWNDKGVIGKAVVYDFSAWTRSGDWSDGDAITERLIALLDRQDLTVSGAEHLLTEFEGCDPAFDEDGETRRHRSLFRVIYREP